jgi:2-polyprenyl-6-methoxyphenol hydroxylase-like FAD-dependent oxidoreductase
MRETDVLIVGAGPVGLTASILLSRLGITHEVIEARSELHDAPQAHVVSSRTMEILTRAAASADADLRAAATPFEQVPVVRWVDTLAGVEHGHFSLVTPERVAKMFAATPCPPANIPQHRFERVLFAAATAAGGEVRFDQAWESSDDVDGGVRSTVRDLRTGEPGEIESRFVVACDGASSAVRREMGVAMEGPSVVEAFTSVHLHADLRPVIGERPGLLFWCIGGAFRAWFVIHDIGEECVMMLSAEEGAPVMSEPDARAAVLAAVGAELDFEIVSIARWRMSSQVAEAFRAGRTFLAGDAAHRFPPTGGIGMNTGIADVHNLCWKLDEVLSGRADESLLDTYEVERRPVALANAAQSLDNHRKMDEVEAALAAGSGVTDAIAHQEEHFDMAGLDLGFRYVSNAVIDDHSPPPKVENRVTDVPQTTKPGYRLSHVAGMHDGSPTSTIDVADYTSYTLAVGAATGSWDGVAVPVVHAPGLGDDEALLVRPDGHVAWRSTGKPEDGATCVAAALTQLRAI